MISFSPLSLKKKIETMISTDVAVTCFNDNIYYAIFLLPGSSIITLNPEGYEDSSLTKQLSPLSIHVYQLFDYEHQPSKHLRYDDEKIRDDPLLSKPRLFNLRYLIATAVYTSNIIRLEKFDPLLTKTTFKKSH